MDMGRASGARGPLFAGNRPSAADGCRRGACGEWPRDRHTRPAGEELDTDPAKRTAVNVGTRPVSPRPLREAGKAQCLLMAPGGGIALVVVVGVTTDLEGGKAACRAKGSSGLAAPVWNARRSSLNSGASWPAPKVAQERVLGIQRKLHKWSTDDQDRRFQTSTTSSATRPR